jgi:hypothetical protein
MVPWPAARTRDERFEVRFANAWGARNLMLMFGAQRDEPG